MKNVRKIFDVVSVLFAIILVFWLTQINYSDLSFESNSSPYLGIITAVLFIAVMQFAKKTIKNKS
ncbi:hypothetical protein DFQ07_0048 [Tenacibaculum caenipelagi]|uniref:Uncharacterized protein n=1 Tax=Tenacibaculum caenipelagi TaxID=1325435 RepID=A0A4R6TJQ2_9FLAO|nr:hypothetical protein DFQ07_0048 [Tenacibaculum caenipelagi]